MNTQELLIKGGTLVTVDPENRILSGDILIRGGRIVAIEPSISVRAKQDVIEARGRYILPGFVQTHVHLCQTLFRGAADDLSLLEWLKERIWPFEAGLTSDTIALSARLGIAEMIKGGTTTALTMESVNHTDAVFAEIESTGFRATSGKCMMDRGVGVPAKLREDRDWSIAESLRLFRDWHGRADGRIRYCFAPRFAISCTDRLLVETAALARQHGALIHTHASENTDEVAAVEREAGRRNIKHLHLLGLTGVDVVLAHCVHLDGEEIDILRTTGTRVAHCPSSNLKLGSGVALIPEMIEAGIEVGIGADGTPCNNRLDMFTEMRTAALLQKVRRGPQAMPAATIVRMATIGGARALGIEREIGSLEIGKRADLQIINLQSVHTLPHPDPVSTIVYAAQPENVESVIIDGVPVMRERRLTTIDEQALISKLNRYASTVSQ